MSYSYYITPEEFEIAQKNGISPTTLVYRVRDLAWGKEKAITRPTGPLKPSVKPWRELALSNGISYKLLYLRINARGWDPMRTATEPVLSRSELAKKATEARRKKRLGELV